MIKRKPYLLLFILAFLLLSFSLISNTRINFSLSLKDTYLVISRIDFCRITAFLLTTLGFLYWGFEKMKIVFFSSLLKIHVFGTLILPIILLYIEYKESLPVPEVEGLGKGLICFGNDYNFYKFMIILILILLQLLFIINIFASIIKKLRTSESQ